MVDIIRVSIGDQWEHTCSICLPVIRTAYYYSIHKAYWETKSTSIIFLVGEVHRGVNGYHDEYIRIHCTMIF